MKEKELKVLKEFYEINPDAPYYPTGSTLLDEVAGGGLGLGLPGGKFINLCGDTSSGKCLRNAYIVTSCGMQYINDYGKDFPYGYTLHDEALTLDNSKSVKADYFYKEKVDHTIKVTTKGFNTVEGTDNHLIGIWTKNGIRMTKLEDVKVGDVIVTVPSTEMYGPYQKLPPTDCSGLANNAKVDFTMPEVVDEKFARFLGYLVADGNVNDTGVVVSSSHEYVSEFIHTYLSSFGFHVGNTGLTHKVSSVYFAQYVRELLGNPEAFTARYKFIPKCILQSPKSVQVSFLQALIDCDSSVDTRGGTIRSLEYITASEKLMTEVRLMLLNMGIPVSIYPKNGAKAGDVHYDHMYYRVVISAEYLEKYFALMGSNKYDLTMTVNKPKGDATNRLPFIKDIIGATVDYIRKQIHWKPNGMCDLGRAPHLKHIYLKDTYFSLAAFVEKYASLEKYFPEEYPLAFFTDLMKKRYCFDTIVSVDRIDKETDVYDFCVPDGHLFWANGMINHNTALAWFTIAANHYYCKAKGITFKWMYDDAEHGSTFDVEAIYGIADYESHIVHSASVEQYHSNMYQFLNSLKDGEMGIYVLDSLDPLKTDSDVDAVEEDLDKMAKGKDSKRGSFDMAKQKYMSSRFFPQMTTLLNEKNALGIIVSQVRYNVSGMGAKFIVGGGKAAEHYYNTRLMVQKQKAIQVTSEGESRDIGIGMRIQLMKNKCPRPNRECQLDVYFTQGVDDVGSCVDYLYQLKTDTGQTSKGKALEWDGEVFKTRDALIKHIYANSLVKELRKRTIERWERLEDIAKERAHDKLPGQQWEW